MDGLLSEFALAHVEGSATVAAYARADLLEKRRPVVRRWADCIAENAAEPKDSGAPGRVGRMDSIVEGRIETGLRS